MPKLHLAIDANEANVANRVGSNVYAFQIISQFAKIIEEESDVEVTVLLAHSPLKDLPTETRSWQYRIIKPQKLWTQLAAPWHLYTHQYDYNVFFTPGHYAPRYCSVPYVSSVMDLSFLHFPDQFQRNDLLQLSSWTKYSVKNASRVIAISNFTKNEVVKQYNLDPSDIVVAHPSVSLPEYPATKAELIKFLMKLEIRQPYFLYLGTLQPRKNLISLVKAYELFCQQQSPKKLEELPQLVIGGKIGWLADPIIEAIEQSSVKNNIVLTDYIPEKYKPQLYQAALSTILVGLYEGFGIPPLESIHFGVIPIVSNVSSLPEVVGEAGLQVNPHKPEAIADALNQVFSMPSAIRKSYQDKMQTQRAKFSWQQSAHTIYQVLLDVAKKQ
ncbi:MAG: Uncharacterized protein XD95_0219 [Microgenomates bacterium 39_7]|nr:MAG: Uncharacterized protein XD95_0219 [Microgenomates bacterium 39_7]